MFIHGENEFGFVMPDVYGTHHALNRGEPCAEAQHGDDSKSQIILSIISIPRKIQTSLKVNCKQHHLHIVNLDK